MKINKNMIYIIFPIIIIIFSIFYLWLDLMRKFNSKVSESNPTSYDNANKALDRIGNWATWLTGLQTAAMAVMILISQNKEKGFNLTPEMKTYGFLALLFFGSSIILTTWLLSSLSSIQQRLKYTKADEVSIENDIYNFEIFSFIKLRLGPFTGLSHAYFLLGILFWAIFIFEFIQHRASC